MLFDLNIIKEQKIMSPKHKTTNATKKGKKHEATQLSSLATYLRLNNSLQLLLKIF